MAKPVVQWRAVTLVHDVERHGTRPRMIDGDRSSVAKLSPPTVTSKAPVVGALDGSKSETTGASYLSGVGSVCRNIVMALYSYGPIPVGRRKCMQKHSYGTI